MWLLWVVQMADHFDLQHSRRRENPLFRGCRHHRIWLGSRLPFHDHDLMIRISPMDGRLLVFDSSNGTYLTC